MSTRDLFERSKNYVSDTDQRDAFSDAESSRNVDAISERQRSFEPQVDYSQPLSFARFGSAELYYQGAFDRIIDFYPYDGSDAEYNEFYNKSLDIEKYIFNNTYPRTNGYVNFSSSSISLRGGPHTINSSNTKGLFKDPDSSQRETANIYDEDLYTTEGLPSDYGDGTRESNLKCDFKNGVTVEFWLKNGVLDTNTKQALFHLTNSAGGDQFTIFLSGTSGSPFFATLSASHGEIFGDARIGATPDTTSITDWNHYAVSFRSASSGISTKFYLNGVLDQTTNLGSKGADTLTQVGTVAHIASGSHNDDHLFFSGSMDEFRFWKTERTAQDIGRNWFGQVRGGSNTDISNTTLGVYYKFNEGITGVTATDSVVLDYSGRISNGTFNGYTATSRNTGSAIVSASAAPSEYLDPIIYANHPTVSSVKKRLVDIGIDHDSRNNAAFVTMMPSWIFEQHEELGNTNFKYLSHIIGSYFDKLYLQIEAISALKSPIYTSSSYKPLPFASHMPSSLGLETPEIFVDANVLEKFINRSETEAYENNLNDVKNLIYLNLYNNLTYLFKSKGTEKAIRNVLRAFNIDDKLVRLNTYADNYTFELENNLKNTVVRKSSVNFNKSTHLSAVVYSSGSATSRQLGFISGSGVNSHELRYGLTHEVDVIFPKFIKIIDTFTRDFTRVSLFGLHVADANSPDTTVFDPSFYVYAERDEVYSKNVKFVLSSSLLTSEISSSLYHGVYDDENWNLSVRIKPDTLDLTGSVEGVAASDYTIEFAGYNQRLGQIRNYFTVTSSVNQSNTQNLLKSPKRIFVGAHRTNVTGAIEHRTDTLITATRYWTQYLDDTSLQQHAFDFENYGVADASEHLSPLDPDNDKTLNRHTLALNYEFRNVNSSDATGGFTVTDISSGSLDGLSGHYGKLGEISSYLYPGTGFGFSPNSSDAVIKQEVNSHQFINPELVIGSDLVKIKTDDDKLFDTVDTIPNYHYILEKSMHNSISEEMLNFFAGVNDFHNLIGHPVHQYRMEYKGLNKLKESFFRRVSNVTEVERFVDYYKWFDDTISEIIGQLIPASADYTPDILNTIESHALERNKYQHRIPMIAFTSSTEGVAFGAEELRYDWQRNHAPLGGLERQNSNWWNERAERQGTISSGDPNVDVARNQIRRVATNQTNGNVGRSFTNTGVKYGRSNFKYRTLSKGFIFEKKISKEIKGGTNFEHNKDIHFTYTALHPAGPVNTEDNIFVPKNVLLGFVDDLVALQDTSDPPKNPNEKVKRNILVLHGRDYEDGVGYKNRKSSFSFPFNIMSSSVTTGYNKSVVELVTASVEITNLHNDVYGPDMERPMQGIFTEHAVGGHQSRHIKLNTGTDSYLNRPEAWKILLGANCNALTGAIGMVGADYPWPEANDLDVTPYPLTGAQKATFFRDELAKRPVNIRNIEHTTGSTILGNYNANYDVVHTVGGYSNPRAFIDEQPSLPAEAVGADIVKTLLDYERGQNGHFTFIDDYNAGYLTGSVNYKNKTVIRSRFSAPGSIETMTRAFTDFRSGDFSSHNAIPFRNLTVRRPFQGVTSSIVSQNTGIRNFDHTGRAFGFTNLAARHSARFFRDSYVEGDTDFPNVPRNTPDLTSPGVADDAFLEAPSFHKVHRNNLLRQRTVPGLSASFSGLRLGNTKKLAYNTNVAGSSVINVIEDTSRKIINQITGSAKGISFSSWVQLLSGVDSNGTERIIYSVGSVECEGVVTPLLEIGYKKNAPTSELFINLATTDAGGDRISRYTASIATSTLYSTGPNHLVAMFKGTSGSLDTDSSADFYFNGVKLLTGRGIEPKEDFDISFQSNYNFRGTSITRDGQEVFAIGGRSSRSTNSSVKEFSGSIDQLTIWKDSLSQTFVNNLYNSGTPRVITGSEPYLSIPDKLFAWYPLGEEGGDAVNSSNPKTFSSGSNSIFASYQSSSIDARLLPVSAQGSTATNFFATTAMDGEEPVQSGFVDIETEECYQVYDNLNIQHQIPRSDRQYSWFAHSITHTGTCELRYSGFMKVNSQISPYYEIQGQYYPFFDYVSGSATGFKGAGMSKKPVNVFQNTTRLNLLTLDRTGSEINTLGDGDISADFFLPGYLDEEAARFNALLIRRGDTYGWNWRAHRMQDHPILHREHQERIITVEKNNALKEFRLPPVSFRGRPVVINMNINGENISLKTTHNNEKIYFNQRELNDLVFQSEDTTITPLNELLEVSSQPGTNLNWIHYSETLFPSTRNEFVSSSRERIGYDNKFWRDDRLERSTQAIGVLNSFGQPRFGDPDEFFSSSIWPLDAPFDFLTRTNIPIIVSLEADHESMHEGKTGELQNQYVIEHFVRTPPTPGDQVYKEILLGPVYLRKQFMTSPNSVVSPSGFAEVGSLSNSFTDKIKIGAGEALWEAGVNATISVKSGSIFESTAHPSEPWFNSYSQFGEDLQLVARDHAIIPEFRISEHIEEYVKGGIFNKSNFDTFEIPGTEINSSQKDFYKDYSNSDFLREFADIKDKSALNAKEIMLTCKAAIRFNPYKGFYPVQRTLDLVSQFSNSFGSGMVGSDVRLGSRKFVLGSAGDDAGTMRPILQPLFSPGILYNSIKSGIAVDYPIVNNSSRFQSINLSGSGTGENYAIFGTPRTFFQSQVSASEAGKYNPAEESFWNFRVPFETMIEPGKYIDKIEFLDFEPHPSASINATASVDASVSDGIYELMSRNFFGQTGDFFLKNSSYTRIESDLIQDGLKFKTGEVFGARLKIRKSHNGKRFYNSEFDKDGTNSGFSDLGAQAFSGSATSAFAITGGYFPLPQDPAHNSTFQETFTMYSRPSAFGPAVSGRTEDDHEDSFLSGTLDSLEGFNWAYTPPYYHGESWADFIFRPESGREYTLEDILSETEVVYWRVDPGQKTNDELPPYGSQRRLITNGRSTKLSVIHGSRETQAPYGGNVINDNAMQIDSSLNLFGVERVPKKRKDKFGATILDQNELAGKRWVIQPKWETPMLNFANVSSGSGNITYPTNFSESVPRGIWHQFGEIPTDPSTGVFLEIGDIPVDWLKGHYDVINEDSVYNNQDHVASGSTAHKDIKSLSELFGFQRSQKKDSAKVRLGEIADKREVYEAVVAIPYILEANEDYANVKSDDDKIRKKFINIPRPRFNSALKEREGSQDGDSLQVAGESIRKMVQKMKRYVLPPQFDFINFDEIDPIVMYFFEFKYEFDKDDLSYIWQNLAPREYKKITFQEAKVSHDLLNNELLDETNLINNPNLRWMVFKVKQKASKDYYDLIPPQIKAARPTTILDKPETDKDDEYLQFNWPYDYLSFVELVKLEADVLYKRDINIIDSNGGSGREGD